MKRNYHDIVLQWGDNPPIALSDMAFGHVLMCERTSGWTLWYMPHTPQERQIAGEYDDVRLTITLSDGSLVCGTRPLPAAPPSAGETT